MKSLVCLPSASALSEMYCHHCWKVERFMPALYLEKSRGKIVPDESIVMVLMDDG